MKKLITSCVFLMLITGIFAQATFTVEGIKYTTTSTNTVAVAWGAGTYTGSITLPSSVVYSGVTYNVTSIGNQAFDYCSSLTSITISTSVTSIGDQAFQYCSSLTSISIPNSVTSIGSSAFYSCSKLTSIIIPNSVTAIGSYAFLSCSSLTSISIPSSVTSIGSRVFEATPWYDSQPDGVVYINTKAYVYKGTIPAYKSIILNEGTTEICETAFSNCTGLTSITIPSSVILIGSSAFSGCSSLNSITIPSSVTSIGVSAFINCKALTSISLPTSIKSISETAFSGCSSLTSIDIPSSVINIGKGAFSNTGLTSIKIPSSVTSIGIWAFTGCANLKFISIPSSVTSLGKEMFVECGSLTSFEIYSIYPLSIASSFFLNANQANCTLFVPPGSVSAYQSVNYWRDFSKIVAINNYKYLNINTPGTLGTLLTQKEKETITNLVVSGTINEQDIAEINKLSILYSLDLGKASVVTSHGNVMPDNAFSLNSLLSSIILPSSITSIGSSAFANCSGLKSIVIPLTLTTIGDRAFTGCKNLTSITLPSSVTTIGSSSFYGCSSLESITIPSSVIAIGNDAFGTGPLITVDINNLNYSSDNGILFDKYKTRLIKYPCLKPGDYIIPNSVTVIHNNAFSGSGLKNLIIPNSVTSIGLSAFSSCKGLTNLIIPNSVTAIGSSAFSGCTSLNSITIPASISRIEESVFSGCQYLSSITLPSTITFIGEYAFNGCSNLKSIAIPSSVKVLQNYAFSGCSGLISIYADASIPVNLSSNQNVFDKVYKPGCILYVPENSIADYQAAVVWNDFTNIGVASKSVQLTIAGGLSDALTSNEKATLPNLTIIGAIDARDFKTMRDNMPRLILLDLSNATVVSYTGTGGTESTSSTVYPANTIPQYAFQKKSGLISVILPPTVTAIGQGGLSDCYNLTFIAIPSSVKAIGNSAFSGCFGLTSVSIPSSVIVIGASAFYNCYGLKTIYAYNPIPINLGTSTNVFNGVNKSTCSLYVPTGSQTVYWVADQWKDFQNIIEGQLPTILLIPRTEFIKVYPNPATDFVKIIGLDNTANISIYNLQGRELFVRTILPNNTISINSLPKGLYIVKVNSREGSFETKLIKE